MNRLFLADLTDRHLTLLSSVADSGGVDPEAWFKDIHTGELQLWEINKGLVGFYVGAKVVLVELLVGRDTVKHHQEIMELLKSFGKPVEAIVYPPGLQRLMGRLGFQEVAKHMRLFDDRL